MIQESANGYAIEFSENHDSEKVLLFSKRCTPEKRAAVIRAHARPICGWAVFKLKDAVKTPTGNVFDTEEKAKALVAHWLKLDRERAAAAASRAIAKANRPAELAGSDPIDVGSLMKKLHDVKKVNAVEKVKDVPPYVWDVSETDHIFARGLGVRL